MSAMQMRSADLGFGEIENSRSWTSTTHDVFGDSKPRRQSAVDLCSDETRGAPRVKQACCSPVVF